MSSLPALRSRSIGNGGRAQYLKPLQARAVVRSYANAGAVVAALPVELV